MFLKSISLMIALIVLNGCQMSKGWQWVKEGSTPQEYKMDYATCKAQGLTATGGMPTMGTMMIANTCMEGKGWEQQEIR